MATAPANASTSSAPNPQTDRARRRLDAERALEDWGAMHSVEIVILRVPGIYAAGRLPLERLRRGTPECPGRRRRLHTNHIHADDLAAVVVTALESKAAHGIYNVSDDTEMKMGDYFDLVAGRLGLSRPPRVPRAEAARVIPPALLSFMSESRRLLNRRMKEELACGCAIRPSPTVSRKSPRPPESPRDMDTLLVITNLPDRDSALETGARTSRAAPCCLHKHSLALPLGVPVEGRASRMQRNTRC